MCPTATSKQKGAEGVNINHSILFDLSAECSISIESDPFDLYLIGRHIIQEDNNTSFLAGTCRSVCLYEYAEYCHLSRFLKSVAQVCSAGMLSAATINKREEGYP